MGLNEDALARYEAFEQSKPAKSYVFRAIDADLRVVGANDLYELAGVQRGSAWAASNLVSGVERAGSKQRPMSPERSACERLTLRARELAENEDLRTEYDAWMAWSAARSILDSVGDDARSNGGQINPSVMNETAQALIPLVGEPDEVRLVVWGYCLKHGISPMVVETRPITRQVDDSGYRATSGDAEPAVHSEDEAAGIAPANASQGGMPAKQEPGPGFPWPVLVYVVLCIIVLILVIGADPRVHVF